MYQELLCRFDEIHSYLQIAKKWKIKVPENSKIDERLKKEMDGLGVRNGREMNSDTLSVVIEEILDRIYDLIELMGVYFSIDYNRITFYYGGIKIMFYVECKVDESNIVLDKLSEYIVKYKLDDVMIPEFAIRDGKFVININQ
ncbi:MAG: hypothetical protein IRZ03_19000 [Acidobacterium ailaaui]|nr:hypothetical protein [Pseudacidobacterium ailaaui]